MFENKVLCQKDTEYGCMKHDARFNKRYSFQNQKLIETNESLK